MDSALEKAFETGNGICFASDDAYFPYLYVAVCSLVKHASPQNCYDIVILSDRISNYKKNRMQDLSASNISIRFVDMEDFSCYGSGAFHISGHVSLATYFRFLIPTLFARYEKVVYLDCDLICRADVAELFSTEMGERILGVVQDVAHGICDQHFRQLSSYIRNTLQMEPEQYFNAGVLLYNIPAAREFDLQNKCFSLLARIKTPRFHDQDILNAVTAGRTLFLPVAWNIQWHLNIQYAGKKKELPDTPYYRSYYESMPHACILHYTSNGKPWTQPSLELAECWWEYARTTPFYETFLASAILGERLEERLSLLAPVKFRFRAGAVFFSLLARLCGGKRKEQMKKRALLEKQKLRFAQKLARKAASSLHNG